MTTVRNGPPPALASQEAFGPWNPGLSSTLPSSYLPLSTIFRPENVSTSLGEAQELAGFSGLPAHDLVIFRPERLVIHELLIRVTAELSVSDGERYADLGINFRSMLRSIVKSDVEPHMSEFEAVHTALAVEVRRVLDVALKAAFEPEPASVVTPRNGPALMQRWFGRTPTTAARAAPSQSSLERDLALIGDWRSAADASTDPVRRRTLLALARAAGIVIAKHGRLVREPRLIAALASSLVLNEEGSIRVGLALDPHFRRAVERHGYRWLAVQPNPIVMNVKGASASGKSTMRPLQRQLAGRLGVDWAEFALISPDIWRKYLLDYESLGPARRYAGMLAGHELEMVDQKLDRYMARKASEGRMSHLLIDRFRFDSFSAGTESEDGGQLLTRFGKVVYLYFMITPPEATVERAWKRGEQFGRYKAVDDLLAHNVEAFTGIPRLFFTWAARKDKRVFFEFLDNSVRLGETPRTVAFGNSEVLNILDVKGLLDVDRFHKINVDARSPSEVYLVPGTFSATANVAFLQSCTRAIATINFVDAASGEIYARMQKARWVWWAPRLLADRIADSNTAAAFIAIGGIPDGDPPPLHDEFPRRLVYDNMQTLGRWGEGRPPDVPARRVIGDEPTYSD